MGACCWNSLRNPDIALRVDTDLGNDRLSTLVYIDEKKSYYTGTFLNFESLEKKFVSTFFTNLWRRLRHIFVLSA